MKKRATDFLITNHGSIILFHALTEEARTWLKRNTSEDSQWLGNALACEPRYALGLADLLDEAGFKGVKQ